MKSDLNKNSMEELKKIIERYTEGNYLIGSAEREEMANELWHLFNVSNRRELLLDFAEYSENDKTSTAIDECVYNYLDNIK
jgi:hypothetical protein